MVDTTDIKEARKAKEKLWRETVKHIPNAHIGLRGDSKNGYKIYVGLREPLVEPLPLYVGDFVIESQVVGIIRPL